VRNTVIMIVLGVLAAATWIATWQRQEASPPTEPAVDTRPLGFYARGAEFLGTDEQGRVTYRVRAERLDELPEQGLLQLQGVAVDYQPADETAWAISAATASRLKSSSQLDLAGSVEVRSSPTDGSEPLTIATEQLRFSPDTSSVESDEPVRVRVGDWQLDAIGLRTHLKGDTLELESQVHGTFSR